MLVAIDVQYSADDATSGLVAFSHWSDAVAAAQFRHRLADCEPYEPGSFYKRELPVLLAALTAARIDPATVVIDGFVDLDAGRPGLGRHLFDALGQSVPVVGVAKTNYKNCDRAVAICRGQSVRPLYVSAAGMPNDEAARLVQTMHGPFRIPDLLKLADSIARGSTAV